MLSKAWTILNKWVNGAGIITTVEFRIIFTDQVFPGVQSEHGGSVAIAAAALPASATGSAVVAAITAALGDVLGHLEQGHGRQLEYLHGMENATKIPVAPLPVDLPSYAAQKRWEKEVGGITVAGLEVMTDDRSKTMIVGARVKADSDAGFTTQWKSSAGFITIDAATIIDISNAILDHVADCFAVEAEVLGLVSDGEITTSEQIDQAFA